MLWIFIGFLICAFLILAIGSGKASAAGSRSTKRRPATKPKNLDGIPKSMHGYHASELDLYRARRKALGKPWEEPAESAVRKFVEYELKQKGLSPAGKLSPSSRIDSLGLDEIDQAELIVALENHYDQKLEFPEELYTLGDVTDYITKNLSR